MLFDTLLVLRGVVREDHVGVRLRNHRGEMQRFSTFHMTRPTRSHESRPWEADEAEVPHQARNTLLLQFTIQQQASNTGLVPYLGGAVGVGGVEQLLDAQQKLLHCDGGSPTLVLKTGERQQSFYACRNFHVCLASMCMCMYVYRPPRSECMSTHKGRTPPRSEC